MTNNELLKKQIIYRSSHRGTKEMDMLLSNFVKKHINDLDSNELKELNELLLCEDEIIYKWYFENSFNPKMPNNKVSLMLKNFKF